MGEGVLPMPLHCPPPFLIPASALHRILGYINFLLHWLACPPPGFPLGLNCD